MKVVGNVFATRVKMLEQAPNSNIWLIKANDALQKWNQSAKQQRDGKYANYIKFGTVLHI